MYVYIYIYMYIHTHLVKIVTDVIPPLEVRMSLHFTVAHETLCGGSSHALSHPANRHIDVDTRRHKQQRDTNAAHVTSEGGSAKHGGHNKLSTETRQVTFRERESLLAGGSFPESDGKYNVKLTPPVKLTQPHCEFINLACARKRV